MIGEIHVMERVIKISDVDVVKDENASFGTQEGKNIEEAVDGLVVKIRQEPLHHEDGSALGHMAILHQVLWPAGIQ